MTEGKIKSINNMKYLIISYFTAFVGGFCVMVIEIVAGRLIARYLGVSLYTWTSVIGVVLAGISFGNYFGGRIADRFSAQRALSGLFILASIACIFIPVLNNIMGKLTLLLSFTWSVRITIHVALIFFLPSAILGMISPVVAKLALDQGFKPGRTIGNIYAWSAAGSIVGTFITGFFLIAHIGTVAVIWTIAGFLGVLGLIFGIKNIYSYFWLITFMFLAFISFSQLGWANTVATSLFLREAFQEGLIYGKDSQYSYISILRDKNNPDIYKFMIDRLTQTTMNIKQPTALEYDIGYHQTFADIVKHLSFNKKDLIVLNLGGGGYLFPRYLERYWPAARIEVVEIDPEITRTAISAFGLPKDSSIRIHHMDARNYIEDLIRRKRSGEKILPFDFIFCDVFSGGLAVPYHLTTYEFNEKVAQLLAPQGLYVINLIDTISAQPAFLEAMMNTMSETFPYTYVLWPSRKKKPEKSDVVGHFTYLLIGSQRELDKTKFESEDFTGRLLDARAPTSLKNKKEGIILTDDYAPVDNLLAGAFYMEGQLKVCSELLNKGIQLLKERRLEEAIKHFEKIISIDPYNILAYNNIGTVRSWQGRYDEAIEYYKKALDIKPDFLPIKIGLASALEQKGRIDEALAMYQSSVEIYPNDPDLYIRLGNALLKKNKIDEAIKNYIKALEIDPELKAAKISLGQAIMIRAEKERQKELPKEK
jgi:tetratricopeptide (TPR) repeat protein/MFS family permease